MLHYNVLYIIFNLSAKLRKNSNILSKNIKVKKKRFKFAQKKKIVAFIKNKNKKYMIFIIVAKYK